MNSTCIPRKTNYIAHRVAKNAGKHNVFLSLGMQLCSFCSVLLIVIGPFY